MFIYPGTSTIFEGTSGSTGISLAMLCRSRGYGCQIYMPDDQAFEKENIIKCFKANVHKVRPVSITNEGHFCQQAKKAAEGCDDGFFADQFENVANFIAHKTTAKEIWDETGGAIDAFVASAGTGGTISGCASFLKCKKPSIRVVLADVEGSALTSLVNNSILYNENDAEGYRVRHPFDTITEGIGMNRVTNNMRIGFGFIDKALRVSDVEALHMAHYLTQNEGLFLGSSSAVNCCAIVKAVRQGIIPEGSTVVTILCDSGFRHLSKFYNPEYIASKNINFNFQDWTSSNDFII
eukprot:GHVL01036051.1.p1 GENE.GHVL01036051.1~~GHVL01036051.1.p1  ORF type:complete len:294 (+),score=50.02 GHVL01036051.1:358-1239(+)